MENTEAKILHRPGLTIKQVLVTAEVPVRGWSAFPEDGGQMMNASFHVNTETWECDGHVAGHPVMAEEGWWKDQCQRVADRVKAGLTSLQV